MIKRIVLMVLLCVTCFTVLFGQSTETMTRVAVVDLDKIRASATAAQAENRIGNVARSAAFVIVLNKNNPAVLWNNDSIDITDRVINSSASSRTSSDMAKIAIADRSRIHTNSVESQLEQQRTAQAVEIERRNKEIMELVVSYQEAMQQEDQSQANRIRSVIQSKGKEVEQYIQQSNTEIAQLANLANQAHERIRSATSEPARSAGCDIVLDYSNFRTVLWFQYFMDITERVVNNVRSSQNWRYLTRIAVVDLDRVNKDLPARQQSNSGELIHNAIAAVAGRSEGYAIVLNKNNPAVLWHDYSIDITDKVIENIRTSSR